jgi:hypothetical protein
MTCKPYDIPKTLVWEAWLHVKANQGAAGIDAETRAFSDPFDSALMTTFRESVRPARLPGDRSGRTWCQPPIRRTCASA